MDDNSKINRLLKKFPSIKDNHFLDSDLIAVSFLIIVASVTVLAAAAFYFAGPVGSIVIILAFFLMFFFFDYTLKQEEYLNLAGRERLLLVANRSLESDLFREAVLVQKDRQLLIIVPITSKNIAATVTDDIDQEILFAQKRLDWLKLFLEENNIYANALISIEASHLQAALDGVRSKNVGEVFIFIHPGEKQIKQERVEQIFAKEDVSALVVNT